MPSGKKRTRSGPGTTTHPKNKYSGNPPDFDRLASLYPSFKPYVFYSRDGRPRIDWTDYNATRELTRVLLLHDHGVSWLIPDGQLCPAVPNRSNYIHWIEDLLSSNIIPKFDNNEDNVRGFDIGTGANCIYPLLGASLLGWSFVGSDATDVALEWAERNVKINPHISNLIEIRKVKSLNHESFTNQSENLEPANGESKANLNGNVAGETGPISSSSFILPTYADTTYSGPPILLGVVRENEKFDFCMCNPPFFEALEEAGLNPKTSCGGTPEEMVCQGGEKAFVTRIIEDSVALKQQFRWYTSMVGKKSNLKSLISKLHEVRVTVVKTTEFVQGRTSRWGLAWSFMPPVRKIIVPHVAAEKIARSFMLEGIQRQFSAIHVLQSTEEFFQSGGASCKLNISTFAVDIIAKEDQCNAILKNGVNNLDGATNSELVQERSGGSSLQNPSTNLSFRVSVFQQIPGTLIIKGSLQHNYSPLSGLFSMIFRKLEETLKAKFCR